MQTNTLKSCTEDKKTATQERAYYQQWEMDTPQPMPGFGQEPPDFTKNAYGPGPAASVYQWIQLFKWPQHPDPQAKIGVSYLKLSIAWMNWSGSWLPIIRYNDIWASTSTTVSQAYSLKITWVEMARAIQKVLKQIQQHSIPQLWPELTPCRVMAPDKFGGPYRYHGLPLRPQFPCQKEAITAFESCNGPTINYQPGPVWSARAEAHIPRWTSDDLDETVATETHEGQLPHQASGAKATEHR